MGEQKRCLATGLVFNSVRSFEDILSKMNRTNLLESLVKFDRPIGEIMEDLKVFGWDADQPFVTIQRQNVVSILNRYIQNQLRDSDVQEWADVIHVREDIGFERNHRQLLREVLNELANPLLTRPLSPLSAQYWIGKLSRRK